MDKFHCNKFTSYVFPSSWVASLVVSNLKPASASSFLIRHDLSYLADYDPLSSNILCEPPASFAAKKKIIYNAALDIYKNHDLLVQWFDMCLDLPVDLVLVGPLVIRSVYNTILSSTAWSLNRIHFYGRLSLSAVVDLYRSASAALLFSDTESFSYPIAEAFYFRLPIAFLPNQSNSELCSSFGVPVSSYSDFRSFLLGICEDSVIFSHVEHDHLRVDYSYSSVRSVIDLALDIAAPLD